VCVTDSFDKTTDVGSTISLGVEVNGLLAVNTPTLLIGGSYTSAVSISPSSVSPVLKQTLTIQLASDFPHTLQKQDFQASITSKAASDYTKLMNVVSVDDTAKSIQVKYGGAWSNDYFVNLNHVATGKIDTSSLTLSVGSEYTAILPTTGSIYGGTLVTITGTNWGNEITDNPVEISYNGALGSTKCYVQTTSAT
jgi:hypothetical protein